MYQPENVNEQKILAKYGFSILFILFSQELRCVGGLMVDLMHAVHCLHVHPRYLCIKYAELEGMYDKLVLENKALVATAARHCSVLQLPLATIFSPFSFFYCAFSRFPHRFRSQHQHLHALIPSIVGYGH